MFRSSTRLFAVATCSAFLMSPPALAEKPSPSFDWLTGCWQETTSATHEVWSRSEGGYLFGYSVSYSGGEPNFFELMHIAPGEPPVLNAYPRGIGPSAFPLILQDENEAVFANAEHDYPQRIHYSRTEGGLTATISRLDESRAITFTFVSCPGG